MSVCSLGAEQVAYSGVIRAFLTEKQRPAVSGNEISYKTEKLEAVEKHESETKSKDVQRRDKSIGVCHYKQHLSCYT